jgi:CheY-like chemotaxis protein
MQNRTALIVDDSRTASMTLRRMLERDEFQVDVLDNAEACVGYLRDHRPGIIFMDHLMPGMDGFQAVKLIKSNQLAAQIPIVMYTANTGELYVGQAQALGAVDILPKPPTRELLRAVFRRLDECDAPSNEPLDAPSPVAVETVSAEIAPIAVIEIPKDAPAPRTEKPLAVTPPSIDLLRELATEPEAQGVLPRAWWLWMLLVAALGFAGGWQFQPRTDATAPYVQTVAWSLGETLDYPYGEAPFGGTRVELVRGLVQRLSNAGFRGTLRLEGHSGQFCLRASRTGWQVADASAAIDTCDVKGFFNKQDARTASARQSAEFRAMLASPAVTGSGIRVVVEGVGDEKRRADYPTPERIKTAGEWNRIAVLNNRIGVSLIPDA